MARREILGMFVAFSFSLGLIVLVQNLSEHSTAIVPAIVPPRPRQKFDYQYVAPFSDGVFGKTFQVNFNVLYHMNFPIPQSQMVFLTSSSVKEFVVVTAANSIKRFYSGLHNTILTVQKHLPTHDIIVYDLGLPEKQVTQLTSACRVSVKKFRYEKYPEHVKNLHNYAWKSLVIHEVLQHHHGVLWLDSSARVKSSNMSTLWEQLLTKTHGALMLSRSGYSNFAVTHPQMYQYLPSNESKLKRTEQLGAGDMLLYRTHRIYNNVIKWWVLCALDKDCIAPTPYVPCHFPSADDHFTLYGKCHRFDQSAINILLANLYGFDHELYFAKDRLVEIRRRSFSPEGELNKC